jgi:hypothetical protein
MRLSGGESGRGQDDLFIAVEGGSQTVQRGWLTTVVRIQCFSERDEAEATRSSWLHKKEARYDAVVWRCRPKER